MPLTVQSDLTKVATFRYPYRVLNYDTTCHFYKSWEKVKDKDFVISPEWVSEKHPGSARPTLGHKAKTDVGLAMRKVAVDQKHEFI
jgi:hypothetical protein